jgi:DNA replication and repair protein RecF
VISPADGELVVGPPDQRRAFVDRLAFLLDGSTYEQLRAFRRALRQRNAGLCGRVRDQEMELWEDRLASAAALVVARRLGAVKRLQTSFARVYRELCGDEVLELEISYRAESWLDVENESGLHQGAGQLAQAYRARFSSHRARDRALGFTTEGPHRHDLSLKVHGRPVRDVLSSGQVKVVAAALRLAALAEVEELRGEQLPVVVDDIDSALDDSALAKLVCHLGKGRQVLVSSARGEAMAASLENASEVWVSDGVCRR